MAALLPDYEYDIFISYRQNDNKYDGWVTKFVENLQKELEATIKVSISVYFDENPHDGLLDTHQVDESLATKLKCLIFIPIVSQTYCDTTSFAWQHEFMVFKRMAAEDSLGMFITLANGNVCSRVLPIKIHNIDQADQNILENELGGTLRSIDFVHQAPGVNRPLDSKRDDQYRDDTKIIYRDQINMVANSIKEILIGIKSLQETEAKAKVENVTAPENSEIVEDEKFSFKLFGKSLLRRNIPQVALVYTAFSVIIQRILGSLTTYNIVPAWVMPLAIGTLILGGFLAIGLAWVFEFGPEGLMRTSSWESRLNPYPSYKRKPFTGVVTISALTLVIIFQAFYFNYFPSWFAPNKTNVPLRTIAVLPFKDDTEDIHKSNYFSKDLTENINIELSKIQSLIVRPSSSTKNYTGSSLDYKEISNALNISVVLSGTVRLFGNQLRIICQLIDVENNKMIWGKVFTRNKEDVFIIQNEIALRIAQELEIELSESELRNIEKVPTINILAYDHYLQGRTYYYKYTKEANDSAVMEFKTAIQLDSGYALAWAGLGDAYSQRHSLYGEEINWNDSSIYAATQAVNIDASLKEAYKALGNIYNYNLEYEKALEYFLKAVEIDSNYAPAIGNVGSVYNSLGQLDLSIEWQLRSRYLNPTSFISPYMLGWTYRLLGDYNNAEKWLKKSLELKEHSAVYRELGYTYLLQGRKNESVELFNKIISLNDQSAINYVEAGLIALYASELDSAEKYFNNAITLNNNLTNDPKSIVPLAIVYFNLNNRMIELVRLENMYLDLINSTSSDDDHRIYLAGIKMMQGKEKEALQWINRAVQSGWTDLAEIDHLPWFSELRLTPEYKQTTTALRAEIIRMSAKVASLPEQK